MTDVVVLGLGSGGEYAARKLAEAGLEVVGVERDLVGGECPFWGCTPSKLLIRSSDALAEARRVDGLAGRAAVEPDWGRPAERIREANHDWSDDAHAGPLEDAGVRVVRGHGRLAGPGRVRVESGTGSEEYDARLGVLLNSGTEPSRVTFTDPEVGSVGLGEEQARAAGIRVAVGRADISRSSRGWIHEAEGVVKVVADADRQVLVGATVVAPYGGEVLGLLAAAVHAEIPVPTLREMHFAYPTFHRAIAAALADL